MEARHRLGHEFRVGVRVPVGGNVLALVIHERRDDFRVPATGRPDLDNRCVGLQAEEFQGFDRVPVLVARRVAFRTMRALRQFLRGQS